MVKKVFGCAAGIGSVHLICMSSSAAAHMDSNISKNALMGNVLIFVDTIATQHTKIAQKLLLNVITN